MVFELAVVAVLVLLNGLFSPGLFNAAGLAVLSPLSHIWGAKQGG